MRSEFAGEIATAVLPTMPVGSPFSIRSQLSPPSRVRKMPPSSLPEIIVHGFRSARQAPA